MLITIVFFIIVIFSLLFLLNQHNNENQYCAATIDSRFKIPNQEASYKVDIKLVRNSNTTGYVKILGTITADKTYSINRVVHFDMLASEQVNYLKLSVDFELKAKNDDVSDEIFNKYFRMFSLNSVGFVEINEINPALYLFSSSLGPYFVCMVHDELSAF
ncbi:FidL-like protein [Providencia burhodogranariea]